MDLDDETRRQVAVAVGGVLLFLAGLVGVGVAFGGADLSQTGGVALVGLLLVFILGMAGAGIWLSRQ